MVPGIADALNPFHQDFSEAEDFVNILRQANSPFASFDHALIDELLPLQQVADSWVHLALQSFGFAGSPLTLTGPQDVNSLLGGPSLPSVADSPAPRPGLQDIGGVLVGAPLPALPTLGMQDMGGFFSGAQLSGLSTLVPQAMHVLLVGEPIPPPA
ncbi:MAG: hypothetical protein QOH98_330 [Methylobacteriaceae bacterium]|jgi:hypothetical protein|nr:hypothetical protein [Methylobacteriaceae bacterium]